MRSPRLWLQQLGIVVLGCLAAGVMVTLGLWQLNVYQDQGAAASAARAAESARPLAQVAPPGTPIQDGYGRTVSFSGRYLPEDQALVALDGDSEHVRVLSAFRTDDGAVVAVVRGIVPASSTVAPAPPTGEQSQSGLLLPSEASNGGVDDGARLSSIRIPALAQTWPAPLTEGYVLLTPADSAAQQLSPAPAVLPESDGRLRNGAYALQWWVFAAFAIGMAARIARDIGERSELDQNAQLDL